MSLIYASFYEQHRAVMVSVYNRPGHWHGSKGQHLYM